MIPVDARSIIKAILLGALHDLIAKLKKAGTK